VALGRLDLHAIDVPREARRRLSSDLGYQPGDNNYIIRKYIQKRGTKYKYLYVLRKYV
jgi:hypothetical protein